MSKSKWLRADWEELAYDNGYPGPEAMLRDLYVGKGMSQEEIGLKLELHNRTIGLKMREYGIPVRTRHLRKPGEKRTPRLPKRGV